MEEEGSQEGRILEYVPSNTPIVMPTTKQTEQQSQKTGGTFWTLILYLWVLPDGQVWQHKRVKMLSFQEIDAKIYVNVEKLPLSFLWVTQDGCYS